MTMQPEGIRNNNPGNIRYNANTPWLGLDNPASDEKGFCRFKDPEWGLRALMVDLHTAMTKDNLSTVEEIITHYAPPTENDTEAYIKSVLTLCNWAPGTVIDKTDPQTYVHLAAAITIHENGHGPEGNTPWYTVQTYERAYEVSGITTDVFAA